MSRIIIPSSIAVWGPGTPKNAPQECALKPTTMYGVTKVAGEVFNLSDGKPVTVIKILKQINLSFPAGKKISYEIMNTAKYEIKKQYLSSAKALRILGWKPTYILSAGLKKTAKWYRGYYSKK